MFVRLITASTDGGVLTVRAARCMACENDVFEWLDSIATTYDDGTKGAPIGRYRCASCGFEVSMDEDRHLIEGTNDAGGWYANRREAAFIASGKKRSLNKGKRDSRRNHGGAE